MMDYIALPKIEVRITLPRHLQGQKAPLWKHLQESRILRVHFYFFAQVAD